MESNLLCDEVWLSTPTTLHHKSTSPPNTRTDSSLYTSKEESEVAFCLCLEKEETYMPKKGFLKYLQSQNLFFSRFRAIQWLIKSCGRLNLSAATLFNAANYLDRFISIKHCHEWKNWMIELLAVACLSVASKFTDTSLPSLYEIQMEEGLDHTFEAMAIQQMELILLNTLGWRLSSTTAYSYVELLLTTKALDFLKSGLHKDLLLDQVTQLLLGTILDYKMVEYRPSITAVSAIWCCLEDIIQSESGASLASITTFFNQIDKDEIVKCRSIMERKMVEGVYKCPSSPVTVLLGGRNIGVYDGHVDLSIFKIQQPDSDHIQSNKKRRMDTTQTMMPTHLH